MPVLSWFLLSQDHYLGAGPVIGILLRPGPILGMIAILGLRPQKIDATAPLAAAHGGLHRTRLADLKSFRGGDLFPFSFFPIAYPNKDEDANSLI
jgi:hypothetical protein